MGKTIAKAVAPDDAVVFGKVGTSGPDFERALLGKKVLSAGSQGKYFWLILDRPPHPVMHFGMTGWLEIRGERTGYTNYYKKRKAGEADEWPPRFWKFQLETAGKPAPVQLAFTDSRRFGRVRLVDCAPSDAAIRAVSPLVENGPDPVVDADRFTPDYLAGVMRRRRVPVKALLLDQTVLSGVGNWVADEVLFQARVHPEQGCDELGEDGARRVYDAVCEVTRTAVEVLGDSDKFPKDWLFNHRWSKGKTADSQPRLPTGEKLAFLTVGGRTSCYAPELQKKVGAGKTNGAGGKKGKGKGTKDEDEDNVAEEDEDDEVTPKPTPKKSKQAANGKQTKAVKEESDDEQVSSNKRRRGADAEATSTSKKSKPNGVAGAVKETATKAVKSAANGVKAAAKKVSSKVPDVGRRRSGRLSSK